MSLVRVQATSSRLRRSTMSWMTSGGPRTTGWTMIPKPPSVTAAKRASTAAQPEGCRPITLPLVHQAIVETPLLILLVLNRPGIRDILEGSRLIPFFFLTQDRIGAVLTRDEASGRRRRDGRAIRLGAARRK